MHFVVTGTHWSETKISSVQESEVGTSQETKVARKFPLLSTSTACLEVNITGCSPEV